MPEGRRQAGQRHVAVVGGGIAGLAAAWALLAEPPGRRPHVTVLEAADRLGGKIATEPFAGVDLDTGPDAFLARVPAAVDLCRELGLADELVAPATGVAYVWTRGALRRLPGGLVLGVPTELPLVARSGIISPRGMARAGLDLVLPKTPLGPDGDIGVGRLVEARFGTELQERLVDPLLGGIHAGRSEDLSLLAGTPQLATAARSSRSLLVGLREQARAAAEQAGSGNQPVFLTPRQGVGRLVDALAAGLRDRGADLRTSAPVRGVGAGAGAGGWSVELGDGAALDADAVVVAAPAWVAGPLLRRACPAAATELDALDHSSVAVLALAYDADAVGRPLDGSGFLVPRVDGRLVTACSWASSKWAHLARPGQVLLRASVGRLGDERFDEQDDAHLVASVHNELAEALELRAAPAAAKVTRWMHAFPQYRPGHLGLVGRIDDALDRTPGLALAGAAMRGVGIPACIESGRSAAQRVLPHLQVTDAERAPG